jgi:hypothetical protein
MLIARFTTSLSILARHPRLDQAADIVVKAAALLAFMLVVSAYAALPTLPSYGHDEAHYHFYYRFALIDDGRWLNYLLHNVLRAIPLPLWSLVYLSSWWLLLYRVARGCAFDLPFAALVASTTLLASPFLEISLWPATVVPALALAGLALWMQARGIAYQVIYVVTGMLIFGALQTLYFVLPLLFLRQFLDTAQPARARWLLLFKHLSWWVAGAVAGVIVMCLMLWPLAGIWFPQPAPWRNVQPVVDGASLLASVRYVSTNFSILLELLLRNGGVTWGFIQICAIVALLRARPLLAQAPALLLLCAVLISFFVFSIPFAPAIHMRSLVAMAAVVVLGLAILMGQSALGRILGAVLLLKMALNYAELCRQYLETHRAETAVYVKELRDLFPGYPMAYTAVALYGTMDPAQPEARRFNDTAQMHPLLASLGIAEILDCRIPARCDNVGVGGEPISVLPFAGGQLELSVDAANIAIIRFRE